MNNLGGYYSIKLIFTDEITGWTGNETEVSYQSSGESSVMLPFRPENLQLVVQPAIDEQGIVYECQAEISLRANSLTDSMIDKLTQVTHRGCILHTVTHNDLPRIFGDINYPLTGTFVEEHGSKTSDLHSYVLKLSNSSLYHARKLRL